MGSRVSRWQNGLTAVQYLLILTSECAWTYGWVLVLGSLMVDVGRPFLPLSTVIAVLALALIAARLVTLAPRDRRWPRVAPALLGLALACLVALGQLPESSQWSRWGDLWQQWQRAGLIARATVAVMLVLFLWWRGLSIGRSSPTQSDVEDDFRIGIFATAALLVSVALAGERATALAPPLILFTALMLASGLVGMPLARVIDEGKQQRHREGAGAAPGIPWLAMLLAVVTGILVATLLLAQLFTFERITAFLEPLRGPLDGLLWVLIYVVALPVGLLLELIIYLGRQVLHPGGLPPQMESPSMAWLDELRTQGQSGVVAPELLLGLKVAAGVALGIALLWILAQALSRFGEWRQQDDVEELHDFVWSWPGIKALWRRLLARFRPLRQGAMPGTAGGQGDHVAGGGARELYRQFLALGAAVGHTRRSAETPLEYERRLHEDSQLAGEDDVRMVTERYVRARYASPASPSPDQWDISSAIARLRALWQVR